MPVPLRVLVVEDSEDDTALLCRELQRGGYGVTLQRVDSPDGVSAAIEREKWDVVICDYSMPQLSGIEALKLLRAQGSEVPVIFVSGTIGEETAVAALKLGAQDYRDEKQLGTPASSNSERTSRSDPAARTKALGTGSSTIAEI